MVTKIYLCPSDKKYGCSWEGSSDDILEHFIQEHEDILYHSNSVNINLDVFSENCLIFVDTEIYLFQTKIIEENLCIFLRYLGPAKIAAKITFDIDLFSNGEKLQKHNIQMKDGYFNINLDCLQDHFGDVSIINCQLLISGDFKSNSSDDGVFLEDETRLGKEEGEVDETIKTTHNDPESEIINVDNNAEEDISPSLPHLELKPTFQRNFSTESTGDLTPYFENLFATPSDGNSQSTPSRPKNFTDRRRTTWYEEYEEQESSKPAHSTLQRSKTFGSEDLKKRNPPNRHPSMRSLGAIIESEPELELRCLNCGSHLAPPIFLCESDHNICSNCYRDHEVCTVCESKITAERNLNLEEKSIEYVYNCKNKKNGCSQKLTYQDICDHELNCTFCFYLCPIEECGYRSPYRSMFTHLNLIHSSVKMFESFIAVFQKHTEIFLANEKMGIFYCTVKVLDDRVVWNAKYCGPKERKFFCELKFKGKNFKTPFLLVKHDDCYIKEMPISALKEHKVKSKNSILAITR